MISCVRLCAMAQKIEARMNSPSEGSRIARRPYTSDSLP